MRKELEGKKEIILFGTEKEIRDTEKAISNLNLSWDESADRLILQEAIDSYNLKADILYEGNTIVPYKKTLREFRKHNKKGTLDNLSNYFYEFLHSDSGGCTFRATKAIIYCILMLSRWTVYLIHKGFLCFSSCIIYSEGYRSLPCSI